MEIRDRIKSLRRVKVADLTPHVGNWRTHPEAQRKAMEGILKEVGIVGAVLARELPDGSLQLLDGHLRTDVAPDTKWPVLILDVTEEEAETILLTYDPIAAMAKANDEILLELARDHSVNSESLQELIDSLNPAIWQGPPSEDIGTLSEYDHGTDTCSIRINEVYNSDRNLVVEVLKEALEQKELRYNIEVF